VNIRYKSSHAPVDWLKLTITTLLSGEDTTEIEAGVAGDILIVKCYTKLPEHVAILLGHRAELKLAMVRLLQQMARTNAKLVDVNLRIEDYRKKQPEVKANG